MNRIMGVLALVGCASGAQAQFSGYYAPANWQVLLNGGDGSVDVSQAPQCIRVVGNDNGGLSIDTDFCIKANCAGIFSFSWSYSSIDTGLYDYGAYIVNQEETLLAYNDTQGSGSIVITLEANDTLCFRVHSDDGSFGPGELTICDFTHCEVPSCYANCDGSGSLNIDDFICFQTFFALGDPTADCDASGGLNVDDFICFQTLFALGC